MKKKDVFFHLRLKNSLSIILIVAVILAALISTLDIFLLVSSTKDTVYFMEDIVQNGGLDFPDEKKKGPPPIEYDLKVAGEIDNMGMTGGGPGADVRRKPKIRRRHSLLDEWIGHDFGFRDYYSATLDNQKKVVTVIRDFVLQRSSDLENSVIQYSIKSKKNRGIYHGMAFLLEPQKSGYMIVIVDKINEIASQKRFILFSLLIFIVSLFVFFIIAWNLSKATVKTVEEAFNRQRQFVADASHELKTPIAVISANISVLEPLVPDNKWLNYIKMENERMGQLVADMLYLAREDSGAVEYSMLPLDFSNVVACSVLPFESLAFEQNKRFQIDIPKTPIEICGDEKKLKQLVIILTDNAMKNSDENAEIKISVGTDGQKAFVKVYNTGHGISTEDKEKIFNRFYRADSSRARETGGCGLGLSIAQSIALGHGGKILVESEVGKFAEFKFILPCSQNKKRH